MPVVNKRTHKPTQNDVYIGRPSKWGNPFVIGKDGNRADVIQKYRDWLLAQPQLVAALPELIGKTLVCWCKPAACHGDVLEELACPSFLALIADRDALLARAERAEAKIAKDRATIEKMRDEWEREALTVGTKGADMFYKGAARFANAILAATKGDEHE